MITLHGDDCMLWNHRMTLHDETLKYFSTVGQTITCYINSYSVNNMVPFCFHFILKNWFMTISNKTSNIIYTNDLIISKSWTELTV